MQAPTEAQRKRGLTARKVVEAFGNCDELAKMYCKHVTWRLNHSLAPNVKGPHVGKEKVMAFNFAVFNKSYKTVRLHDGVTKIFGLTSFILTSRL